MTWSSKNNGQFIFSVNYVQLFSYKSYPCGLDLIVLSRAAAQLVLLSFNHSQHI